MQAGDHDRTKIGVSLLGTASTHRSSVKMVSCSSCSRSFGVRVYVGGLPIVVLVFVVVVFVVVVVVVLGLPAGASLVIS